MFFATVILVLNCEPGTVCILRPVYCFHSPCDPVPICVPEVRQCPEERCLFFMGGPPVTCSPNSCLTDKDCEGLKKCCRDCSNCGYCTEHIIKFFTDHPPPSCVGVICEPGSICMLDHYVCSTTPCNPLPKCVPVSEICDQPAYTGPCKALMRSWWYDKNSGLCRQFNYGGCRGNKNRFSTHSECVQTCSGIN